MSIGGRNFNNDAARPFFKKRDCEILNFQLFD